jgi:hypothetical protein
MSKPFSTEPYHDPTHNLVQTVTKKSGKILTLINCLSCGKLVRIGEEGESPWTNANEQGGIRAKDWFCSRPCFQKFQLLNSGYLNGPHLLNPRRVFKAESQRMLAHDIYGLMPILERDFTGGATIHERRKDAKDKPPRDEIERRMRKRT